MSKIKAGSVVRLKSGSPWMTVVRIWEQTGTVGADGTMAYCQWFNQDKLEEKNFHIEVLEE
jgi:Uncharacterized small protein (DUF2158).